MNIRVRAAGEVALSVIGIIVGSVLVAAGLDAVMARYGIDAILFGIGAGIAGYLMYLAWQVRVSQLEFAEKYKVDQK